MTTYATLRTRIEGEIYDTSLTTEINSAIQDAIKFYERKKFWFNQKTGTFATVASQEYYDDSDNSDIPGMLAILSMQAAVSTFKSPVDALSFEAVDAMQNGSIQGMPKYFAYFNEQIRLYPIPDAAYTVTAAYHYRFPALSADADSNPWTTDAEELIRTRAKRILALHKLWDVEMYARLMPAENEALSALQAETTRRRSVNRLTSDYPPAGSRFNINIG